MGSRYWLPAFAGMTWDRDNMMRYTIISISTGFPLPRAGHGTTVMASRFCGNDTGPRHWLPAFAGMTWNHDIGFPLPRE
jgi:hypothetical protein